MWHFAELLLQQLHRKNILALLRAKVGLNSGTKEGNLAMLLFFKVVSIMEFHMFWKCSKFV